MTQVASISDRSDAATAGASLERVARLLERLVELHEVDRDPAEALDAAAAARLCGIGRTRWLELDAEGLCPAPISLGPRCPRWIKNEVLSWLRNGAVPRSRWVAMRDVAMRRVG